MAQISTSSSGITRSRINLLSTVTTNSRCDENSTRNGSSLLHVYLQADTPSFWNFCYKQAILFDFSHPNKAKLAVYWKDYFLFILRNAMNNIWHNFCYNFLENLNSFNNFYLPIFELSCTKCKVMQKRRVFRCDTAISITIISVRSCMTLSGEIFRELSIMRAFYFYIIEISYVDVSNVCFTYVKVVFSFLCEISRRIFKDFYRLLRYGTITLSSFVATPLCDLQIFATYFDNKHRWSS